MPPHRTIPDAPLAWQGVRCAGQRRTQVMDNLGRPDVRNDTQGTSNAVLVMRREGGAAGDVATDINRAGLDRRVSLHGSKEIFDRCPRTDSLRWCGQFKMTMELTADRRGAPRQPAHVVR